MIDEVLHKRGAILVRRLVLDPGEAMAWHTDPFVRLSVVLHGEALAIEHEAVAKHPPGMKMGGEKMKGMEMPKHQ